MKRTLSPKELAQALGVSESSLKRWADKGRVRVSKTVGGHRRIPMSEAIRFAREAGYPVVKPEVFGLSPVADEVVQHDPADDAKHLLALLKAGEGDHAKALVMNRYFSGETLPRLFDGPLRSAMYEIGKIWHHDPSGIYLEHRATDIALQIVNQLRSLVGQDDSPNRPVALGGGPSGDAYLLPSMMCAALAAEAGYREINLGPNTPIDTLTQAITEYQPSLVWFTCTVADACPHPAELDQLLDAARAAEAVVALGGQGMPHGLIEPQSDVYHLNNMADFHQLCLKANPDLPAAD
ncbi:MAG: helix-turn-helix domain-containing protein [Planctomycetota bacterium]